MLDWRQTVELAPALMRITAAAYVAEFTDNLGLVPEKDILDHYDPSSHNARKRFIDRTQDIHERGARITVIRNNPGLPLGYMKIGPAPQLTCNDTSGRYQDAAGGYDYKGYYLNNILVNPELNCSGGQPNWNRGLGSLLLHAGFTLNECEPQKPLVLDAFDISTRVNAWYERLGLVPNPEIATDSMLFGNTELSQTYYATPENYALGGVIQQLEKRIPQLQDHTLS